MGLSKVNDRLFAWGIEGIEPGTLEQAQRTAELPFVYDHVALMPDAHIGIGATVGSVIATKGAIIPAAIGVDIGCGMNAVRLSIHGSQLPDNLDPLQEIIARTIPSGVGQGNAISTSSDLFDRLPRMVAEDSRLNESMRFQLGSLGSGNHFIELCLDEVDYVWLVLHSGSRGVGNKIATRHINEAKGLLGERLVDLADPALAHLTEGTWEFWEYIRDMLWAQDYAAQNRAVMMDRLIDEVFVWLYSTSAELGARITDRISCHHNYTEQELVDDQLLWVTRKGAIRAGVGDRGIIPGSMATGSYIVSGLGNPASFNSASHGAGRKMSRGQAKKNFTAVDLADRMKGKAWNKDQAEKLVDEISDSYKTIEEVMAAQADLVQVEHTLIQYLNVKGS